MPEIEFSNVKMCGQLKLSRCQSVREIEIIKMLKSAGNWIFKLSKKCGKLKLSASKKVREIEVIKMSKTAGNWNYQNVEKFGIFKISRCQKVREIQIIKLSKSVGNVKKNHTIFSVKIIIFLKRKYDNFLPRKYKYFTRKFVWIFKWFLPQKIKKKN